MDRRMVETEPKPAPIRRINQQDDIEKAKKVGDFMGKSMFNSVGDEYPKYLRANWERTKIPLEHFEHFEASGGAFSLTSRGKRAFAARIGR